MERYKKFSHIPVIWDRDNSAFITIHVYTVTNENGISVKVLGETGIGNEYIDIQQLIDAIGYTFWRMIVTDTAENGIVLDSNSTNPYDWN